MRPPPREEGRIKSAQERCTHCALAVIRWSQKNFAQPQTPFPGAQDGQNLISWRWSLYTFTYKPSLVKIDARISSYGGNRPTNTHLQTNKPTDRTDYNTLHCSDSVKISEKELKRKAMNMRCVKNSPSDAPLYNMLQKVMYFSNYTCLQLIKN